jgi:formate hydrogenlyase subunit 3/multisubunit Na+/H+ antiporter MnhD subunit
MSVTAFGFGLLALAVWGVPGLAGFWPTIAIVASVISIVMLVLFWDNQLVFGVAISLLVILLAGIRPEWIDVMGG